MVRKRFHGVRSTYALYQDAPSSKQSSVLFILKLEDHEWARSIHQFTVFWKFDLKPIELGNRKKFGYPELVVYLGKHEKILGQHMNRRRCCGWSTLEATTSQKHLAAGSELAGGCERCSKLLNLDSDMGGYLHLNAIHNFEQPTAAEYRGEGRPTRSAHLRTNTGSFTNGIRGHQGVGVDAEAEFESSHTLVVSLESSTCLNPRCRRY